MELSLPVPGSESSIIRRTQLLLYSPTVLAVGAQPSADAVYILRSLQCVRCGENAHTAL